jgi:hypothetical protein
MNSQNNRFPKLIQKVLIDCIVIGICCILWLEQCLLYPFIFAWHHKLTNIYDSVIISAMIVRFLIKFFASLESISGCRITSRGLLTLHSKALNSFNWFLLVVHIKGQEHIEIKYVIKTIANCEPNLCLCKIQVLRKNAMNVLKDAK